MRFSITILCTFLTAFSFAQGQPERIVKVDSVLTDLTRKDLFSGAVLIADRSTVLLSRGYGYADWENKVKNTPETRFSLSSARSFIL